MGIGTRVLLRATFLHPKHTIQEIEFAPESIEVYDHPAIYKAITLAFSGQNFYTTRRWGIDDIMQDLQTQFPIIASLEMARKATDTLYVTVYYHVPTIKFISPTHRFVAYDETIIDVVSGNTLGQDATSIWLPEYTSGLQTLDGIFYQIDQARLTSALSMIYETLEERQINKLSYLPGGGKLIVDYNGKVLYFHLTKDLTTQLAKLIDLETYYTWFNDLSRIDLGSSDDIIIR